MSNSPETDLQGRVAIVTGGGRGTGRAFAQALAEVGMAVAVTARSEDQLQETVSLIERDGWRAIISLHLTVSLESDEIVFRIAKIGAGSLPLPAASVVDAMDAHIDAALEHENKLTSILTELTDVDDRLLLKAALAGGVKVRNQLHWSNGERRFRIVDLRTSDGDMFLEVEPL